MSLKSARIRSGRKVSEVMRCLGVTDSAIYQWESGVTKPRTTFLPKLAQLYGCTVDDLLADEPERNNPRESQ